MTLTELLEKLKAEYNWCDCIEFMPFPSISPELQQGYMVVCNLYEFSINCKEDCANCKFKHETT